ncbi:nicotinate-nucleotide--dimethylbenzimidazole phosphoribosyltransferase [Beggiatoa leptomitoformis]|uniref:Nicotinate-nucleotide--dimethylbenzimidazole phosphoribosyltransferase n=1 Tax=Beggiatoa leptomitoformis TaxID=288004 RepID=A0A2N9YJ23_9GAMM|nr:nicotinate-nucleotide--dimethylbenzimidazole phosphoribosyltransferase [Beggiatoa leptomitoformis]ALG69282.1 nicotinate-nucleotide--dimethylbenzimidazole phosphoribosyltransferase [Beggiatoa leptomitoformis]AUI70522.1 nicotinate-nucleotide--dimethylbenzimidazole phosphoribosyltransferase [Beggiatoa leptomitoformis]
MATFPRFIIPPINQSNTDTLRHKIDEKTKPRGALGQLETLALQIGCIQNSLTPQLHQPTLIVFAGDHGISAENVSPYPQSVTYQMVLNFLAGGAAINVFAKQHQLDLQIVDAGVNYTFNTPSKLINAKIAYGTKNFLYEPAMTFQQCHLAIEQGATIVRQQHIQRCNMIGFGEMGIANTASASVLMHLLTNIPLIDCVGRGTGLNDAGLARKYNVLQKAIATQQMVSNNPLQILATFGGFEIAMLVGAYCQAAACGMVILVDGFIATVALLVAIKQYPFLLNYCIFSHCSHEKGHRLLLEYLHVDPLLQLNMRLGEGSGAAIAYPLLQSAVLFLNEMASFTEAKVSNLI